MGKMLLDFVGARILAMFWAGRLLAMVGVMAAASGMAQAHAAQTPRRTAARPAYPIVAEIEVDGRCRVMPDPMHPDAEGKKPRFKKDEIVCHLETESSSQHEEDVVVGNERRRNRVKIEEQEYVLQNVTAQQEIFVVEQPVRKDWQVDSDPQPVEMRATGDGSVAVFRVRVEPGEVVRLHVGVRHTTPLKTKVIRASAGAGGEKRRLEDFDPSGCSFANRLLRFWTWEV